MPARLPNPTYHCACRVLKSAQYTKFEGQTRPDTHQSGYNHSRVRLSLLMEGGETRNRFAMPPMEKPMSWVDMTTMN